MSLTIFQVLQCVFLTVHVFQCFSPYFMSYHVSFSFSSFISFLAIFQVLNCVCLILHVFQCFSPYSRSYSVCVLLHLCQFSLHNSGPTVTSYFTFITVSRHIPGPTVTVSHYACFSVFLGIFHVLPC